MQTREEWLEKSAELIARDIFMPLNLPLPKLKYSIGFTGSRSKKAIGAHWSPTSAVDGIGQIYIVPTHEDSISILSTLTHELIHAAVGNDKGHGPVFKKAALKVGLEGKMREAGAGKQLRERLNTLVVSNIGEIPHGKLNNLINPKKKQGTRLLKAFCLESHYTVRVTKSWVDVVGYPICPCCNQSMRIEEKE